MKWVLIGAAIVIGLFMILLAWALCFSAAVGDERYEQLRREQARRHDGDD